MDIGHNLNLLLDIVDCNEDDILHIVTNGGAMKLKKKGKLILLPLMVYFDAKSMAVILSLASVVSLACIYITMDTCKDSTILVHFSNGQIIKSILPF